jgi:hypothetical protein
MDPTALFSNIGNLTEIGIHPLRFDSLSKGVLMHAGRATGYHDSIQTFFADGLPDDLLSRFGAHIDVIRAVADIFDLAYLLSNRLHIYGPGNIDSAMADKDTQFLHKNNLLSLGASGKAQGVPE